MRTTEEWSRLGGLVIAGLAVLAASALLVPRLLGFAAGPEVEVITALKRTESYGLSLSVPGASVPLTSQEHHFARITVTVEPGGKRAVAHSTLDFKGTLGATQVGTAGVERSPFVSKRGDWVPETTESPGWSRWCARWKPVVGRSSPPMRRPWPGWCRLEIREWRVPSGKN